MRTVSDESIQAQAKQPDMQYMSSTQIMDVADSLGYGYEDYKALAMAVPQNWYSPESYAAHRESIRAQAADYLAECIDNQADGKSIIGAHW